MTIRIATLVAFVLVPTIAKAIDVPEGEPARKAWCAEYGAPSEPRKPKFMTGSQLRQEYWKDQLGEAEMTKLRERYDRDVVLFSEKSKANDARFSLCETWGMKANR